MAERDGTHSPDPSVEPVPDPAPEPEPEPAPEPAPKGGRLRRATAAAVVGVFSLAAAAAYFDVGERLGITSPDPAEEPAAVAPPFVLPAAGVAPRVAKRLPLLAADPGAVSRAVSALAVAPKLGKHVSVAVGDASSGTTVFTSGASVVTPASLMKLLTTAAALSTLGVDHRFATTVVRAGRKVVLVGGGDPLLTVAKPDADEYPQRADLTTLARQTARALKAAGVRRVRLGYDTSLFTGSPIEPTWEPDYIPDNVVSPITSLWVNEGRMVEGYSARYFDPALAAAQVFAKALSNAGVRVTGPPRSEAAPDAGSQIAAVYSAPLAQIVQHTLELSDNEAAEVLARQVAVARGDDPSFSGSARAVKDVLEGLGVRMRSAVVNDGSGLSRADRLSYTTLLDVLQLAVDEPRLRMVAAGLPVSGFSGSLSYRFETTPHVALGEVRAKTGTLTGVNGYAGTVVSRDGVLLTFVVVADRVKTANTVASRTKLDQIAAALASCICRG